jgi:hypothetical protein
MEAIILEYNDLAPQTETGTGPFQRCLFSSFISTVGRCGLFFNINF